MTRSFTHGPDDPKRSDVLLAWISRILTICGILTVLMAVLATGSLLIHGHPAYLVLLVLVGVGSLLLGFLAWKRPTGQRLRFKPLRAIGMLVSLAAFVCTAWLVPSAAQEPALSAMDPSSSVEVVETATQIVQKPAEPGHDIGLFFQPGAKVDARAYAAVLRPLAEQGYTVVIPKQPLGIGFLSTGAFEAARDQHAGISRWVVGGHSLGGVVSAMDAERSADAETFPVAGLLLFASYPAGDLSEMQLPTLSLSGSNDGLSKPEDVVGSKALLPADAIFTQIQGGTHAFFGDYGPQRGDGQPGISHDSARSQISEATVAFFDALSAQG